MIRRKDIAWIVALVAATGVLSSPSTVEAQVAELDELVEFHRALTLAKRIQNDTTLLGAVTLENYVVVPPGGLIETRREALSGVRQFASDNATVEVQVTAEHENTAVLVGTVEADGEVTGGVPQFPRIRFMAVYVRTDGLWRLLAQSNTPCHPRAIQAGRC